MATQELNEVQRNLVNQTVRPSIEMLVGIHGYLDRLVLELDNQQTPILSNGSDLGDGSSGQAPRTDAPVLTGTLVTQLRNFANSMKDQISATALKSLIELSVRDVNTIARHFPKQIEG